MPASDSPGKKAPGRVDPTAPDGHTGRVTRSVPPRIGPPVQRAGLGIALRVAAMLSFALMSASVKWVGGKGIPVFEIILFRNLFAFIPLFLYSWRPGDPLIPPTRRPLGHLTRSGIGLLSMICSFSALQYMPLSEATAFGFAAPMFMTALSAMLLKEFVGPHRWAAVLIGFVGVLIMVRPAPGHFNGVGVSLALAAAAGSAGVNIAIRQMADTEKGSTIVFYFTLAGTALGLAGSLVHWVTPDPLTLALLVLSGLLGGVGQILITEALQVAAVAVVAPFDYTQLVWTTGVGFLIWGELPHTATVVGAAVVAMCGLYILHRELRRFSNPDDDTVTASGS